MTNLSDARYFAGMGVELLAFPLSGPGALTPDAIRELAGWVAGIRLVGEVDATLDAAQINALISECGLDYVLLSADAGLELEELARPVIRVVTLEELDQLAMWGRVAYAVLTGLTEDHLRDEHLATRLVEAPVPVLLAIPHPTVAAVKAALEWLPTLAGLALEGGQEDRPGIRDFGELGDALEALERF
ncbi:MAG TPA: hypothetical protein VEI97_15180 [bacterium]|nr:hypothetical protein [bacterium]